MDPLLRRFIDAASEADAEHELNTLIEAHALPLANVIVARKLRAYSADKAGRSPIDDREDVVADAMMTLVERLQASRLDPALPPIENLASYAATVIHSACAHQIRRRYPERARLKNRLRYVFSMEPRLALWNVEGDVVCGLTAWDGRAPDRAAEDALHRAVATRQQGWMAMSTAALTDAALSLVIAANGPVDFETFVAAVASAARLVEPRGVSDASLVSSSEPSHEIAIDQRRFLVRVWDEVRGLPVRQRIALLLNLRDANGAGLLWLLPIAGIATIRQIARILEIPDGEFAKLWRDMPIDDATIGLRLGCTRQQVINLRMAARKRLMNRVPSAVSSVRDPGATGNLRVVSASVKGSV
jgi:DNA-directed RNA polymerase specialized sigma24 family protein